VSPLLVPARSHDGDGCLARVSPESAGWQYVGFEVQALRAGAVLHRSLESVELCLVVLSGSGDVVATGAGWERFWAGVGGRDSVFHGPPHAIYLPPDSTVQLSASTDAEVALCMAPATRGAEPALITPDVIGSFTRGSGSNEREIRNILMEDRPAESLLVTEVLTPGGHWSSYPPHKHDTEDLPRESYLEETYYHRLRRVEGWAVQRIYSRDTGLDETIVVHDGDVVLVPGGYHPVSATPGYDLYYLNVMAGPVRKWQSTLDPDLAWLA